MLQLARLLLLRSPGRGLAVSALSPASVRWLATDRFAHERSLLSVSSDASPSELKAGYGRAVEAAKGSSPGPLLPVKIAELASAFRLLSAVEPSTAGPALTPAPASASSSSGLTFDLAPDAGSEPSDKQKQTDLRAGRALAAAKAYAMAKGGGDGGGSGGDGAGSATNHSSASEQSPEWVVLGKDVEDGWKRALAALDRAAVEAAVVAAAAPDPDAANKAVEEAMATAEAVFRRQAELVNADVEHYNLLVPILRMQRAPKMDRLLDIKVKAARAKALSN